MPEMSGYELAAIVRKKFPLIKIQMASGFSSETQVKDKAIVSKYVIAKPYRKNTLLRTVRRVLDQNAWRKKGLHKGLYRLEQLSNNK